MPKMERFAKILRSGPVVYQGKCRSCIKGKAQIRMVDAENDGNKPRPSGVERVRWPKI